MPGMTDEFALQFSYEDIDLVLFGLERGLPSEEIVKEARVTLKDLDYIKTLVEISSHMRRMPSFPEL
jgi:NH3-dependent NAD+ synthetase